MTSENPFTSVQGHPLAPDLALPLLVRLADKNVSSQEIVTSVLEQLIRSSSCQAGGTIVQEGRQWATECWTGPAAPIPEGLVADALDAGAGRASGPWAAAPLVSQDTMPRAVILNGIDRELEHPAETVEMIGRLLGLAAGIVRRADESQARCQRLQAILDISANWHEQDDPESLLHRIADAATDLLDAERASIFLWDRARKKLIGKPALGVDQQPLEVDDSAGIVGKVLQTGEPRRWQMSGDEEAEVNRAVDRQLNFVTRSLVAVPLCLPTGKRAGVFEVINKHERPFTPADVETLQQLALHASAAIRNSQDRQSLLKNRDRLIHDAAKDVPIIGNSAGIQHLRETVERVAPTELALLILGENGTGKEVLARNVHFQSSRRHEPFVAVNCAALVESLLESELFGHEKGAFTDAHQSRPGRFESAHGGTLFLDEIGDMSAGGQAKLLRVLEEKVVVRVGGSTPIPVDVRVIAATNQPLAELIAKKEFREDLFFRLNVVSLELPPLRERGDDIILLAEHFLREFSLQIGRQPPVLTRDARKSLMWHRWPGNIRELRNLMERVSYLCPADQLHADDLALTSIRPSTDQTGASDDLFQDDGVAVTLNEATRRFQVRQIRKAIEACQGNVTDAAARLGLHRSNLYRKMRQVGMETPES